MAAARFERVLAAIRFSEKIDFSGIDEKAKKLKQEFSFKTIKMQDSDGIGKEVIIENSDATVSISLDENECYLIVDASGNESVDNTNLSEFNALFKKLIESESIPKKYTRTGSAIRAFYPVSSSTVESKKAVFDLVKKVINRDDISNLDTFHLQWTSELDNAGIKDVHYEVLRNTESEAYALSIAVTVTFNEDKSSFDPEYVIERLSNIKLQADLNHEFEIIEKLQG